MRVVIALGGNALLPRGEALDLDRQRENSARAARTIGAVAAEHAVVITHGNGPQVGLLALQAAAYDPTADIPLDVLGAESEGMIGYLLERELANALHGHPVATLLTQVEVDATDAAFRSPSKPIGPLYDEETAAAVREKRGFDLAREGRCWRRVVASPQPKRILELDSIRLLVEAGHVVICAGGGGIPVAPTSDGGFRGVEAVVDKDRTAALLAEAIGAELLLLVTDVSAVFADWPRCQRPLLHTTAEELHELSLDSGSMGPKVEAACQFVSRTGKRAAIGDLDELVALVDGRRGTQVRAAKDEAP